MRMILPALVSVVLVQPAAYHPSFAQTPASPVVNPQTGTEMTTYYAVFLRRGPAWTSAVTPETSALSKAHQENIQQLTKRGKMVVAGPFMGQTGDRALAGLFVLRAESSAEAVSLVETDPAVKAGRFVFEIVPWMGPTSLRY